MSSTIHDLARIAGCNASTVSRALHGDRRVAAKTRDRIVALAKSLHYVPNQNARNLVTGRTGAVALVVSTLESVLERTCARALTQSLNAAGLELLLLVSDNSWERMTRFVSFLRRKLVDGVFIIPPNETPESGAVLDFASLPVPQVWIDRYCGERFPVVTSDNAETVRRLFDAAEEAGAGFYLLPPECACKNAVSQDRFQRLVRFIDEHNKPIFFDYAEFITYGQIHRTAKPCIFSVDGFISYELAHASDLPPDLIGCFVDFITEPLRGRLKQCFVCRQNFDGIAENASRIMLKKLTGAQSSDIPEFLRITPFPVEPIA